MEELRNDNQYHHDSNIEAPKPNDDYDKLRQKYSRELSRSYGGASTWRELLAKHKVNHIVSALDKISFPKNILEIGCGEGAVLNELSSQLPQVELYGLEISQSGAQTTRSRGIPNLVECKLYNGLKIPFSQDQFNLTVITHVLEHAEYPRKMLYEAQRVSTYTFVEVPLADNLLNKDGKEPKEIPSSGHINFFNPRTIKALLHTSGYEIIWEQIYSPGYQIYLSQSGSRIIALLKSNVKKGFLHFSSFLATLLFTYHGSYLCQT